MAKFSNNSLKKLDTCHPDLITLFNEVIKHHDFTIIEGYRGQEAQDKAFEEGKSKLKYPNGKHNKLPSEAIDAAPYPIDWNDKIRFYYFAGIVLGTAEVLRSTGRISHSIRWGGDWDRDDDFKDNTFNDLVHFEIVK